MHDCIRYAKYLSINDSIVTHFCCLQYAQNSILVKKVTSIVPESYRYLWKLQQIKWSAWPEKSSSILSSTLLSFYLLWKISFVNWEFTDFYYKFLQSIINIGKYIWFSQDFLISIVVCMQKVFQSDTLKLETIVISSLHCWKNFNIQPELKLLHVTHILWVFTMVRFTQKNKNEILMFYSQIDWFFVSSIERDNYSKTLCHNFLNILSLKWVKKAF